MHGIMCTDFLCCCGMVYIIANNLVEVTLFLCVLSIPCAFLLSLMRLLEPRGQYVWVRLREGVLCNFKAYLR